MARSVNYREALQTYHQAMRSYPAIMLQALYQFVESVLQEEVKQFQMSNKVKRTIEAIRYLTPMQIIGVLKKMTLPTEPK